MLDCWHWNSVNNWNSLTCTLCCPVGCTFGAIWLLLLDWTWRSKAVLRALLISIFCCKDIPPVFPALSQAPRALSPPQSQGRSASGVVLGLLQAHQSWGDQGCKKEGGLRLLPRLSQTCLGRPGACRLCSGCSCGQCLPAYEGWAPGNQDTLPPLLHSKWNVLLPAHFFLRCHGPLLRRRLCTPQHRFGLATSLMSPSLQLSRPGKNTGNHIPSSEQMMFKIWSGNTSIQYKIGARMLQGCLPGSSPARCLLSR